MKIADFKLQIGERAAALRAAAGRTENVEQLEAIERDFEKLVGQARRISQMQNADCRLKNGEASGGGARSRRAGRGRARSPGDGRLR